MVQSLWSKYHRECLIGLMVIITLLTAMISFGQMENRLMEIKYISYSEKTKEYNLAVLNKQDCEVEVSVYTSGKVLFSRKIPANKPIIVKMKIFPDQLVRFIPERSCDTDRTTDREIRGIRYYLVSDPLWKSKETIRFPTSS